MRTMALVKKEFLQFWRDPVLMVVVLWVFTVDVFVCARNFSLDIMGFPIAVCDMDCSQASSTLLSHLQSPRFRIVESIANYSQIDRLLLSSKALVVIVVDADFSRDLARGQQGKVQLVFDGTNSNSAALAMGNISNIFSRVPLKTAVSLDELEQTMPLAVRPRVWFNQNLDTAWFVGLVELFCSISMVAMLLPAAALVREKEYGTVEQLLVSPVHPWQIMAAKIIPMTLLVLGATLLSLYAVLGAMFDLYAAGPVGLFLLATAIYVGACAGFGMLLATLARNLSQVILLVTTVLAPVLFLSGSWTPPEAMPVWLQWFTKLSPLSYYLEIGTGIFFRQWGLTESLHSLLMLTALGAVSLIVGTTRVGRQLT